MYFCNKTQRGNVQCRQGKQDPHNTVWFEYQQDVDGSAAVAGVVPRPQKGNKTGTAAFYTW